MNKEFKRLTQIEIFNALQKEAWIRIVSRNMFPDNPKYMEQMERESTIYAIKNTWFWFNNQEEFHKKRFFV